MLYPAKIGLLFRLKASEKAQVSAQPRLFPFLSAFRYIFAVPPPEMFCQLQKKNNIKIMICCFSP
jgi:hypothetical protein